MGVDKGLPAEAHRPQMVWKGDRGWLGVDNGLPAEVRRPQMVRQNEAAHLHFLEPRGFVYQLQGFSLQVLQCGRHGRRSHGGLSRGGGVAALHKHVRPESSAAAGVPRVVLEVDHQAGSGCG